MFSSVKRLSKMVRKYLDVLLVSMICFAVGAAIFWLAHSQYEQCMEKAKNPELCKLSMTGHSVIMGTPRSFK